MSRVIKKAWEVNFDGLVGPTHHYGGLSWGNIASQLHGGDVSNPRHAAMQGIAKMKLLADLGIKQAVLPPYDRPDIAMLGRLGFTGSNAHVLEQAYRNKPSLLEACSSASPLPAATYFGDEGAANHTRLCRTYAEPGIEIFVYGRTCADVTARTPKKFPARQSLEASDAVARVHQLSPQRTVFIQQNPDAIDAGVFHNDVISVGNQNVLLYHEHAFVDTASAIKGIRKVYRQYCGDDLITIEVGASQVSLEDAVASYLFNSQLVTLPDGAMSLICASECLDSERSRACIEKILEEDNPIRSAHHVDVHQSMKNGGGPACLRLRVLLTEDEMAAVHQPVLLSDRLYSQLHAWIDKHYRDELRAADLADPKLLDESRAALDELTQILQLGTIYLFQRV
jgi:succinylarginine dihydrolase